MIRRHFTTLRSPATRLLRMLRLPEPIPAAVRVALITMLLAFAPWVAAQTVEDEEGPLDLGTTEKTSVRLVLMDVVVVDSRGATVAGLGIDDFEAVYRGRLAEIDTLDVDCSAGSLPDPAALGMREERESIPAPESGRRTVLLFDYMHMSMLSRENSLRHAERLIGQMDDARDEAMLVALTGGLRIEHGFSADRESLLAAVDRMRHDVTLWNGNFDHLSEAGFVAGMKGLMTVLETVPGRKSLVLFSSMQDVPLDQEFSEIAALAAGSRCSIYPIDSRGMFNDLGVYGGVSPGGAGPSGGG